MGRPIHSPKGRTVPRPAWNALKRPGPFLAAVSNGTSGYRASAVPEARPALSRRCRSILIAGVSQGEGASVAQHVDGEPHGRGSLMAGAATWRAAHGVEAA